MPSRVSMVIGAYKRMRKMGRPKKESLTAAKRLFEIQKLKKRFPEIATPDFDKLADRNVFVSDFKRRLSKALKLHGKADKVSGLEAKFALFLCEEYGYKLIVKALSDIPEADVATQQRQFANEYLKNRLLVRPLGATISLNQIADISHHAMEKATGEKIKPFDIAQIKKFKEGMRFEYDFAHTSHSLVRRMNIGSAVERAVSRMTVERKVNDPQTQRKIIDILIRDRIVRGTIDREMTILLRGHDLHGQARVFLTENVPGFQKKPEAIQERLVQEAVANMRGIIGTSMLIKYWKDHLAEYQIKLQRDRSVNMPEPFISRAERILNVSNIIVNHIFSKPENILYATREIPHLWPRRKE